MPASLENIGNQSREDLILLPGAGFRIDLFLRFSLTLPRAVTKDGP